MRGRVEVQSSARRSYRAVVIPTDALLTFGMLKLTSLIMLWVTKLGNRRHKTRRERETRGVQVERRCELRYRPHSLTPASTWRQKTDAARYSYKSTTLSPVPKNIERKSELADDDRRFRMEWLNQPPRGEKMCCMIRIAK